MNTHDKIDLKQKLKELEQENLMLKRKLAIANISPKGEDYQNLKAQNVSKDSLLKVYKNDDLGHFQLNDKLEIVFINDASISILGVKNPKSYLKPYFDHLKSQDLKEGEVNHFLLSKEKDNGLNLFEINTLSRSLEGHNNYFAFLRNISGSINLIHDLMERQARYRSFIDRMNEGIIVVDFEGRVNFVNPKFCEFIKKKKEDLLGKFAFKELNILNFTQEEMLAKVQSRKGFATDSYQLKMQLDDGSIKWFKVSAAPILNSHDEPIGSVGIHMDITSERKVESENRQLLNVMDNSADFVLITDGQGNLKYFNDAFKQFTGLKANKKLNREDLMKFFDPKSHETVLSETTLALFNENKWVGEVNLLDKNKNSIPFSVILWTQKDEKQNFEFFACIARNISAQKYTQRELAILARIPDENPFPVIRISGNGILEYANKASVDILRKWEVEPGEKMPDLWIRIIKKCLKDDKSKEFELTSGSKIFELLLSPIPEYQYVNIFGNDITSKKLSGIELKSSERRYKAVVEDQTEFISRFLPNGTITFANRAYCEYFGLERNMIIGKNLFSNIPDKKLKSFKNRLSKLSFEEPVTTYDERLQMPDGTIRWQLWTDRAIYDEHGKFVEYQSVGQDITKVKLAEEAISQQRKYLRDIIDANPNAIYVRDSEGIIKMLNKAAAEMFSIPLKELIHFNPEEKEWAENEAIKTLLAYDMNTIDTGKVKILPELKMMHRKKLKWYQTIKTRIKSPDGNESQVLSVSSEITDRKIAEEELKFQLDLKEMIATLSTQFINLHWRDIDRVLEESLAFVGEFTGVDRAIITEARDEKIKISQYWSKRNPEDWRKIKTQYEKHNTSSYQFLLDKIKEDGFFVASDIEKLKLEKEAYYKLLKKGRVRSLLILPMFSKGRPIAFLSLVTTRQKKKWNPDTIALFRILTQVFSNARERKEAELKLSSRMNLEKIITHISSRFINIEAEQINVEIEKALQQVGEFMKTDQAFVILRDEEASAFTLSHYWSVNKNTIQKKYLRNIPAKNHIWEFKQLRDQQLLLIDKTEDLPSEASDLRAIMELLNISSLMVVPISYEHKFYGALGFTTTENPNYSNDGILPLLKILGQVIANALERKKVEESLLEQEEIYRILAKNIPRSTVFLYDRDLRYKLAEGDGLQDAGLSKESVEGKTIYQTLHKDAVKSLKPYYLKALRGEELTLEKKFGQQHYLMHFLPVKTKQGPINMGMIVSIDITNLKEIQQELENQTMELKRSNEDLEQFAYAASHDLQEPLRMVSSYVHLIKRRLGDALEGEIKEFMDFATDGAARMQDLINDLLEYSRVDRAGKDFEEVDLLKLVKVLEQMLQNTIAEAGAIIKYDSLPKVKGDKSQLYSLLQNLIENAIKFRGEKSPVVEIGYKEYKNKYNIWIKDNGIGIDERFSERIFVIFQRLNNRTSYSGTGIGLAICKKIVERHGGRIWVKSTAGKGSAFYFDLKK